MSRSPEVEDALKFRAHSWASEALAAEVERLEAELAKSDEAARAAMYALDERAFLAECSETSEKRAEAAEARVAMADQSIDELQAALNTQQARVNELEQLVALGDKIAIAHTRAIGYLSSQNARLRAALERLDALYISEFDHEDRPPRPQWLQEALNGE